MKGEPRFAVGDPVVVDWRFEGRFSNFKELEGLPLAVTRVEKSQHTDPWISVGAQDGRILKNELPASRGGSTVVTLFPEHYFKKAEAAMQSGR